MPELSAEAEGLAERSRDHVRHSGCAGAHWCAVPSPTGSHVYRAAHTNIDLQLGETYSLAWGLQRGATVNINSQELQALPTNKSRKYT